LLHLLQHARIREIVGCRFELNHSQNPINRFPLAAAGREFAMNNENIASIAVERLHQ